MADSMMPSDAAFREAVEKYGTANYYRDPDEIAAARARVLALYAERQGEVGQITDTHNWLEGGRGGTLTPMYSLDIEFQGDMTFNPGDRVRVTKVEEGT